MTTHLLFPLEDMETGTARKIEIEGHSIALVRIDDDVYALGDTCSHADVSLSEGFVEPDDCVLECHRHGALFDLKTGEPLTLPAVKPVPVFATRVIEGRIELTVDPTTEDAS